MKKKLVTAAMTFGMVIGTSISALAYSKEATVSSAADANGSTVTAAFTLDDRLDWDLTDEFFKISEAERKSVSVYFGSEEITADHYACGSLDLSQTGASADNPVTLTFSMADEYGYTEPTAGQQWLYVVQKSEDGTSKLIPAQSAADNTVTAQFTDSGISKILITSLDLAREALDYQGVEDVKEVGGIQSAVDAKGNPVNATAVPLDRDRKCVAVDKAYGLFQKAPFAAVEVNLEESSVSADNPVTVTFLIEGVTKDEQIFALHKKADGEWEKLTGTAGDGTVEVTFTSLSPVAFVRTGQTVPTVPESTKNTESTESTKSAESTNPPTGDENVWKVVVLAVLSIAISAAVFTCYKKKRV